MLDWFIDSKNILREDMLLETRGECVLLEGIRFRTSDDHWKRHCLVFDERDPRFPKMDKETYIERAMALAMADAKPSTERDGIIGYRYHQRNKNGSGYDAITKVLWNSDLHPGYCEHVSYKVEGDDINITTYMLRHPWKTEKELKSKDFLGELPENEKKEEEEVQEQEQQPQVQQEPQQSQEEIEAQRKQAELQKKKEKYARMMKNKRR